MYVRSPFSSGAEICRWGLTGAVDLVDVRLEYKSALYDFGEDMMCLRGNGTHIDGRASYHGDTT